MNTAFNSQRPTTNSQPRPTSNAQLPTQTLKFHGHGTWNAVRYGTTDWNPKKPYDLRERLFEFGCLVIRLVRYLHTRGPVAMRLSEQILKAGTSAPANYEESDDATGDRDKAAKRRIALRELKEVRMRMLRRCDLLSVEHDPVIKESDELVRIVATDR